ncbi:MAG TPA: energy-coupled thiamine transporter ThiT, partial [Bacillales bacterium]|nr:energy-coupled thiamine transporter ThiT [Bacillales bacterium]
MKLFFLLIQQNHSENDLGSISLRENLICVEKEESETMSNRVNLITEIAIMVAAAFVLSFVGFDAPWAYGGSISLEMLPIILMAYRRGVKAGIVTGMIFGIVDFLTDPSFVHPISILVDYPIAFLLVGFAGILKPNPDKSHFSQGMVITIGTLFGTALRFVAHFISGLVWWRAFAPEGTPVWIYSLVYNAGY